MSADIIRLFHGSYCEVRHPDLSQCRRGKDFGVGFYLTTSKEQAVGFTRTAILKAKRDGRFTDDDADGYVSAFIFESNKSIKIKEFKEADSEWLHCVAAYRKSGNLTSEPWDHFDVIIGKIANDRTNLVITAYLDGAYGEVGSESADSIAISLLEPENLKDQFCFRTQKAIETLSFVNSERIKQ